MEVGVISRQVPCFSGAGIDSTRSNKPSFHGEVLILGRRDFGVSLKTRSRRSRGHLNSVFCDDGHVQYYREGPMCGGKKEKEKEKEIKKKMKLLKGLTKELAASSQMGFRLESQEVLAPQFQGKLISEGAEALLLKQLEQLRAEEKELKIKRKEEKARLKAERMKTMIDSESSSSSSSSESSGSECGEVIDMNRLRGEVPVQPVLDGLLPFTHQEGELLMQPSSLTTQEEKNTLECGIELQLNILPKQEAGCCSETSTSCSSSGSTNGHNGALSSSVIEASTTRIEVCMGNKCKKSGGGALLEEFERVMGVEGTVVGCKCMGKCKNGPNVRVLNTVDGIQSEGIDDSVRTPSNPLYIGVGLEDVSLIVANLIGEEKKDFGLVAAT